MDGRIKLVHGNGGRYSQELMARYIMPYFKNDMLEELHDGAQFSVEKGRLAFTTDSFVVKPRFFPGGNIGKLAICGTVNDLVMNGAIPKYISCGLILEEGLPLSELETILQTMAQMAEEAGVQIVTGDTKVVEKGAVDGIYINTSGIGVIPEGINISPSRIQGGMQIILTGAVGDHAISVMGTRYDLTLPSSIETDCAPLHGMIRPLLETYGSSIALMRDPTRGGVGTVLNEVAQQCHLGILVEEEAIPVHKEVASVCNILGYDPLYLANEGKALLFVEAERGQEILRLLKEHPYGKESAIIGYTLSKNPGKVALKTSLGGIRLIEMLGDDQVPRIC